MVSFRPIPPSVNLPSIQVLWVDDDETLQDSTIPLLKNAGIDVELRTSARQALQLAASRNFDLILLDLVLGPSDLHGLEVLDRLRHQGTRTPVLVVTGFVAERTEAQAAALGAVAVMSKPVDGDELITNIRAATENEQPWPSPTGQTKDCEAKTILFHQGDFVSTLFLIVSGIVKLARTTSDGKRDFIVGLRRPGTIVGASASLLGIPQLATAETITPCRLSAIPIEAFAAFQRTGVRQALWVARGLAKEAVDETLQAASLSLQRPIERTAELLRVLAKHDGMVLPNGGVRLPNLLTQQELAQLVGITREHLNRALRDLESAGAIRRERDAIVIPAESPLCPR